MRENEINIKQKPNSLEQIEGENPLRKEININASKKESLMDRCMEHRIRIRTKPKISHHTHAEKSIFNQKNE